MPAALDGIRVLDLSQLFPGPYCTMILADLGAEVIKVEPVGVGDFARFFGFFFEQINRNKKSLALNLKDPRAWDILQRLAQKADVLVEGFRPGTTSRLGVDFATLRAINPRLVYCSISGFGQDGPYRSRPGHDINYMSLGGALGLTRDREGRPVKLGIEIVDITSGMNAAIGILAALLARARSGEGQYIDISMLDCTISLLPMETGYCLETGESPAESALNFLPHYGIFETADGDYLVLGIVHEDWFWTELCDALDLKEERDLTTLDRITRKDEIISKLCDIFATRSLSEWLDKLAGYDIPYSRLNNVGQALDDPQLRHRGMVVELPGGERTHRYVASPLHLSSTPPLYQAPGPGLGEHTQELLKELGMTGKEIQELRETGAIE